MSKINQGQSYFNKPNARTATPREQNNSNSNSSDIVSINSEQSSPITYANQAVNPSLNQVKDLENQIEEEINVIAILNRAITRVMRLNDSDFRSVETVYSKTNTSQEIKHLCSLVLNDVRQTCNRRVNRDTISNEIPKQSPAQIIVEAVKILEESHNIENNYSGNEADKDTKKKELEEKSSKLTDLANRNMINPNAGFTAEELPFINDVIKNQNLTYVIRLCAMSLIYNSVAYHKKQLEESSLDAIVKVLKEDKINSRKIQEYSLILLAKSAEKGQVLEDNILDEVSKFVNSNLAEKAILVFNQAKDHSNISDKIIDELKKIARNLNMTGNSKKNEKLQNLVAEIIEYDRNKKIQVSIDNIEKISQYGRSEWPKCI